MTNIVKYNDEGDNPPKGNNVEDQTYMLKYLWLLISEIGDITKCYLCQ